MYIEKTFSAYCTHWYYDNKSTLSRISIKYTFPTVNEQNLEQNTRTDERKQS